MPQNNLPPRGELTPEQRAALARKRKRREEQRRRAMQRYYMVLTLIAIVGALLIFGVVKLVLKAVAPAEPDSSSTPQSVSIGPVNGSSSSSSSSEPPPSSSEPEPEPANDGPADPTLWSLLLANVDNPIPEDYEPQDLTLVDTNSRNGQQLMDARAAQPMKDMLTAAKADGIDLVVRSAYRSHASQTQLFNSMKQSYIAQGLSEEQAIAETKKWRNVPGTSEHETGLCADIVGAADLNADLVGSLAERDWAVWLKEHAADYGFILRYPDDKTDITGTSFEPWHYRYVGVEDAKKIMEKGICLEEYLGKS